MGGDVLADVHVCVDPELTVSEAHRIAEDVRAMLQDFRGDISDVVVHVDPGTPAQAAAGQSLPAPAEVRARLAIVWPPSSDPERTTIALHYRHRQIDVDVLLVEPGTLDPVAALEALSGIRADGPWLGRVRLLTTLGQQS
jgi:hypothetical protein